MKKYDFLKTGSLLKWSRPRYILLANVTFKSIMKKIPLTRNDQRKPNKHFQLEYACTSTTVGSIYHQ